MKILTEKAYNAAINKAFLEGYEEGRKQGKGEALFEKNTVNQIREALGLCKLPIEEVQND